MHAFVRLACHLYHQQQLMFIKSVALGLQVHLLLPNHAAYCMLAYHPLLEVHTQMLVNA